MNNFDITYIIEAEKTEDYVSIKGRLLNNKCIVAPFINMLEDLLEQHLDEKDFTDPKDRKNPFHLLRVIKERNKNVNEDTKILFEYLEKIKKF